MSNRYLAPLCAAALSVSAAQAATTEIYTFDATLTRGYLSCGPVIPSIVPCPFEFGTIVDDRRTYDDLVFDMAIGGTYAGRIELSYADVNGKPALQRGTCLLNGKDCAFGRAFLGLGSGLRGPAPGVVDFSESNFGSASFFDIQETTGRFAFGTDIPRLEDGTIYTYNVNFELNDVTYSVVPLPASLPFLLVSFGGLALLRRRKS